MSSQPALARGAILDERFEIIEHSADGGMAAVYRARDLDNDEVIAIKLLHRQFLNNEEALARFEREAEIAARLNHPGIIKVYGHGVDARGHFYLAMEWLEGYSIDELIIREGPLFPKYAGWLILQAAHCLAYSHSKDILHRDLKPDNIFVIEGDSPSEDRAKVLDFGIGKVLNDSSLEDLTMAGTICGTPEFMSPEQSRGRPLDARADLYSLGCVFYAMITGSPPFVGENVYDVLIRHVREPLPPMPDDTPRQLVEIITQATAKKPEDRQASLAVFARQLQAFLADEAAPSSQIVMDNKPLQAPDPSLRDPSAMRTSGQLLKLTPEVLAMANESRTNLPYVRDRSSGEVPRLSEAMLNGSMEIPLNDEADDGVTTLRPQPAPARPTGARVTTASAPEEGGIPMPMIMVITVLSGVVLVLVLFLLFR